MNILLMSGFLLFSFGLMGLALLGGAAEMIMLIGLILMLLWTIQT